MARENREWHASFSAYMEFIVNHPHYKGLAIKKAANGSYSWIATAKSQIGQQRSEWALQKADELNIPLGPGVYANVMREIHPTKFKVCQICGESMSIYYHYPSANFLKAIKKEFGYDFTPCDHIAGIWDSLVKNGISESAVKTFLIQKFKFKKNVGHLCKEEMISQCEIACREGGKKLLSPGAMSNFPDRFDGFHTYNRCCRANEDKGRSRENLKSYTKDRRAYEYWSDGNIHAANKFMGSEFFYGTSADHIGPISLGFVHDPRYLQPMGSGENSTKRDRLAVEDIEKIIEVEKRTNVYPMSWYSSLIWEYIKDNYDNYPDQVAGTYRNALKQNMVNYMFVLGKILKICGELGEKTLIEAFLEEKYEYFKFSYTFNSLGEIINISDRHFTDRIKDEMNRYGRIAMEAVDDFNQKNNRHTNSTLTAEEYSQLNAICSMILSHEAVPIIKSAIVTLMVDIQKRTIAML